MLPDLKVGLGANTLNQILHILRSRKLHRFLAVLAYDKMMVPKTRRQIPNQAVLLENLADETKREEQFKRPLYADQAQMHALFAQKPVNSQRIQRLFCRFHQLHNRFTRFRKPIACF